LIRVLKKPTDGNHSVPYSGLCAAKLRDNVCPEIDSHTTREIFCGMLEIIFECTTLASA
jgi:hypothetical protein